MKHNHRSALLAAVLGIGALTACNLPGKTAATATPEPRPTATHGPTSTPSLNPPQGAIVSPDGMHYALVRAGGVLVIGSANAREQVMVETAEITEFAWFPNSRKLVYVDRSPTDSANPALLDRVWLVDIDSTQQDAITGGFAPRLSPDGRYLAFIRGARAGDACIVDYELGIVEFNDRFVPTGLIRQTELTGLPVSESAHTFQPDVGPDLGFPGQWQDDRTLEVAMRWSCADPSGENGRYAIDTSTLSAEKIGELSDRSTYLSSEGRYSLLYPADQFDLLVDQIWSVDGELASAPGTVSLLHSGEPALVIASHHVELERQLDSYGLAGGQDPYAAQGSVQEPRSSTRSWMAFERTTSCSSTARLANYPQVIRTSDAGDAL